MLKNVGGQTEPQPLDTKALARRLIEIVRLVGKANDCTQLRRRLKTKGYTDGETGGVKRWTKTPSGKHRITCRTAVLALFKPVDERNTSGLWRAYDLNEKRLGMPDDYKNRLSRNSRKKILETQFGKALVKVVVLIKTAEDPKKLNDDVLKVIASYPETKEQFT